MLEIYSLIEHDGVEYTLRINNSLCVALSQSIVVTVDTHGEDVLGNEMLGT